MHSFKIYASKQASKHTHACAQAVMLVWSSPIMIAMEPELFGHARQVVALSRSLRTGLVHIHTTALF